MKYSDKEQRQWYDISRSFLETQNVQTQEEYKKLVAALVFHEHKYYIENDPILSDFEYDQLYKLLENTEDLHPEWVDPDSPTQRVSPDLSSSFQEVEHKTAMLSLDNSYDEKDLLEFDRQVRKLTGLNESDQIEYVVEPKYDGGSIALLYENDRLIRAATRGNGFRGEEITQNARSLRSVPMRAEFSKLGYHTVEIRGEALIRKDRFDTLNKLREQNGEKLFANPRNAATGGLRMKDAQSTADRAIEVFAFQLGFAADAQGTNLLPEIKTHKASIEVLGQLGFKIPRKALKLCKSIEEVVAFCDEWQERRDEYPYEIDGMVVKVNRLDLQEICGSTSHHPRWAIAFKFKAKQATSTLKAVEFQVGKIGSITPVAKIEPVFLAGVTVSSISLHNEDFIQGKDLRLGDKVLVERAGDVIPYIVRSLEELRTGDEKPIEFPKTCPVNDTDLEIELVREEGEAAWRCPHCVCGAQDLQRLIFHVSKDAMDIEGLGRSQIEKFWEMGWIRDMADIYRLDYSKISELEGYGEKSVENLRNAIEKAKKNPIHRLLHSLSIHHVGKKLSQILANELRHVMELKDWNEEQFIEIKDIGPVATRNIMDWFSRDKNLEMLERMESYGVNLEQTNEDRIEIVEDGVLLGKSILFTGTLQQMGRKEAQKLAEKLGAKNISAVSKNLDILVVGEKAGSKLKKAEELGTVQILTEEQFLALVPNSGS